MTDYSELVKALRRCDMKQGCFNANCRYSVGKYFCDMDKVHKDAAAAIEALNRLVDLNTQRCEALRKQLREAHESYERHLNDLEAQLPKRGKWIEDATTYAGPGLSNYKCSLCGKICGTWRRGLKPNELPNWCGNCGADMRKMEVQDG